MEKKKFLIFIAVCFGLSLLAAGLFHFLGGKYSSLWGTLFASGYMLLPMVSVIVTQLICHEAPFSGCGVSFKINRWWFLVILVFLLIPIAATLVSALLPGVSLTVESDMMKQSVDAFASKGTPVGPWGVIGIMVVSAIFSGATINALFAFGEEIAWRGFLARVCDALGFWKKSVIIGAVWGLWHAPIILMGHNYPAHPVTGVFMMIAFCTLMSPLLMYFRERSGSVLAAAIGHGTLNAIAGISLILLAGGNDLLSGPCGLAGMLVLIVLDLAVFADRKFSAKKSRQMPA